MNDSPTYDPIFIGGEGRSGTTLLRVMLDSHSAIACGPETHFLADPAFHQFHQHFTSKWSRRAAGFGYNEQDIDDLFRDFAANWFERYMRRTGKRRWADKTPQNIHIMPYLWRLFPTARFIHVIRDGRDVACSIVRQKWGPNTIKSAARRWVDCIAKGAIHRPNRACYLETRYEDLVLNSERETLRIMAFIGEPWEPALIEYWRHEHDLAAMTESSAQQVRKPIYSSSIGRWQTDLSTRQLRQFQRIAGATLMELGYQ